MANTKRSDQLIINRGNSTYKTDVGDLMGVSGNISIDSDTCLCAEIDLSGELRGVSNIDKRISEAERLGYDKIIVSHNSKIGYSPKTIKILKLKNLNQLVKQIFKERG